MRDAKASLLWITSTLNELNIPFQIAGGLAARAYGATRDLVDIDIDVPEDKFELIKEKVSDFIIFGPSRLKTENWDLLLITLNHHGQEIDLSGAYQTKIFNQSAGKWHELCTDFSKSVPIEIFGLKVPVISREDLLAYKKILARPVDLADIEEVEKLPVSQQNNQRIFETERLFLRKMTENDVDNLQLIFSDPIAMQYYPKTFDIDETKAWIQRVLNNYAQHGAGLWVCHLKSTNEFVGQCGLFFQPDIDGRDEVEVGYLFVRKFWHQGFATEAALGTMKHAREKLGFTRLVSLIRPENKPSIRVAERNGLIPEKEIDRKGYKHIVYVSEHHKNETE